MLNFRQVGLSHCNFNIRSVLAGLACFLVLKERIKVESSNSGESIGPFTDKDLKISLPLSKKTILFARQIFEFCLLNFKFFGERK